MSRSRTVRSQAVISLLEQHVMKELAGSIRRFLVSEDGPTAVEYAVMGAFIMAVVVGAVGGVAQGTLGLYAKSAKAMP